MHLVTKALAGCFTLIIAAFATMLLRSDGHGGILIRSSEGRFTADTNIRSDLLGRNLEVAGFRRCIYFTGMATFTTLAGTGCPWYMSDQEAVYNPRERAD